jgi:hypothetical protein
LKHQSYSLTLTRWHHVDDRLAKEMTRLDNACQTKLSQTSFSVSARNTAEQSTVDAAAAEVDALMTQHETLNEARELIRISLGHANATEGVSAKLAQVDRMNRRMKMLTSVLAIEAAKVLTFDDYKGMEVSAPDSMRPRANPDIVKPKILSNARIVELEREIEAIRRKIHGSSDKTSEMNRAKLSLELPPLAAQVAGLTEE